MMSRHIPNPKKTKPHHEGCGFRLANRDRSCQITKAEKKGTRKPWEKSESGSDHCATRRTSTGMYSQSNNPAIAAICHHGDSAGDDARSAAGIRASGGTVRKTSLNGTDSITYARG